MIEIREMNLEDYEKIKDKPEMEQSIADFRTELEETDKKFDEKYESIFENVLKKIKEFGGLKKDDLKLMEFIELSLHLGIQFIIATHSPLLLGLQNAKILNLDIDGAPEYKWDELENIKILKHFFNQQEQ